MRERERKIDRQAGGRVRDGERAVGERGAYGGRDREGETETGGE